MIGYRKLFRGKLSPQSFLFSCARKQSSKVRVRFGPSPTGLLHLGGFRTALLNYLFAIKENGTFIIRIEDTDQTRLVPNASEMLEEDLKWLGIFADESPTKPGSYGPYVQSKRLGIYHDYVKKLIDSGHAYECFCTEKRLDLIRKEAVRLRQRPRYDNKCRDLSRNDIKKKKAAGEKYCIRFKMEQENVTLKDLVDGPVTFDLTGYNYEGDMIIIKTDEYPTYHFANVVDDHLMDITHVLRGVEWQVSTPKHLQMYRSFGWQPPQYAHLPLIMNTDGTKLSKRQGDISIQHYRDRFYYPLALINFVTKSGGGFEDHNVERIYNFNELARTFNLSKVNTHYCKLDFALLDNLNQVELCNQIESNSSALVSTLKSLAPSNVSEEYLKQIITWCPQRITTLKDLTGSQFAYLWSQPTSDTISRLSLTSTQFQSFSKSLRTKFSNADLKDREAVKSFLHDFAVSNGIKQNNLMKDLRSVLCGLERGPPIVEIVQLFGVEMTCQRIQNTLNVLAERCKMSIKT